jgi:hypothetical protein
MLLLLAESNVITWGCMAVLLLMCGILLLRTQRYFARQVQSGPPTVSLETPRSPTDRAPLPEAAEHWEVEMHELARDLSGRLDSKMSALQHLIRDADRAAARLETALHAAGDVEPRSQAEGLRADQPRTPADAAQPATAEPGRYDEIYLLFDYGHPAAEIAQRVGLPIGEVELILSLRTRRG